MKLRYLTLLSAGAVLAALLAACSTTAPGTGGGPPPTSASCAVPATLPGSISTPMTLQAGCYAPSGDVSVDAALTLDAGVTIVMPAGAYLDIGYAGTGGRLVAQGTAANPVTIEGAQASKGYWVGIEFYSKTSSGAPNLLSHTIVRDGGASTDTGDVSLYDASVTIADSQFLNSQNYGITADGSSRLPGFSSNTITGNTQGAMEIPAEAMSDLDVGTTYTGNGTDRVSVSGTVDNGATTSVHWPGIDVPFYGSDSIDVSSPVTVDPGFVLEMAPGIGAWLDVGYSTPAGTLNVQGTSADPAVFESWSGQPGDWIGIEFYSKGTVSYPNVLNHAEVNDAGANADTGNVSLYGASATISNSKIQNGKAYGIYADGSSTLPGFSTNVVTGNTQGAMDIPAEDMSQLDVASSYTGNASDYVYVGGTVDNGSGNMVHWPAIDVPFFATDPISLDSPVTADAGMSMVMGSGNYIDVGYSGTPGSFYAHGTAGAHVVFRAPSPGASYWDAINFYSPTSGGAPNILDYTTIEDGGAYTGEVYVASGGGATVTNSRFLYSNVGICVDPSRNSFSQSGNSFDSSVTTDIDTTGGC